MMWDRVMVLVIAAINDDAILADIYGENVRQAGANIQKVPILEWTLLADTESELWAPVTVQFDQWNDNAAIARRSELQLRRLFHQDRPIVLGSDENAIRLWSQYVDGSQLSVPDRYNFAGRALRFQFTPLRRRFALPGT